MEQDRYKQNHFYYIVGMGCLIISLGLFSFSLYIFPNFILGWQYDLPSFVTDLISMLQEQYHTAMKSAHLFVFIILDLPAVILFIIADVLSNKIDNQIYGMSYSSRSQEKKSVVDARYNNDTGESKGLVFKMIMVIVLVFIVAEFFQWAIS